MGFVLKTGGETGVGLDSREQYFDGNVALELWMEGFEDLTHASTPNPGDDFIFTNVAGTLLHACPFLESKKV